MEPQQVAANQFSLPVVNPKDKLLKYFKGTGIMLIVGGSIMFALGAIAIGITAQFAYVAVPVWSGVFVIVSGILALVLYSKRFSRLVLTSLISMSAVSACMSLSVVVIGIIGAYWEIDYYCYPLGYDECRGPYWARVGVDSLIAIDAVFTLAVCIVVASIGGYKACACCRACCFGNQHGRDQTLLVYKTDGNGVPLTLASNPGAGTIYAIAVPQNANMGQAQYQVGSTPPQGQTVLIPLGISPQNQVPDQTHQLVQVQPGQIAVKQDPTGNGPISAQP